MGEESVSRFVGIVDQPKSDDRSACDHRRRRRRVDKAPSAIANERYDIFACGHERPCHTERLPERADNDIGFDAHAGCEPPTVGAEDPKGVGFVYDQTGVERARHA